jgi:PAS domain S-box-containing protein
VFQSGNYRFRSDAANLLRNFADQAAIAVKNARLYEAVIAEKQRLDAILEQNADGVMILNPQLEITVFNKALSRMTGWSAQEAIGKPHDDVIEWAELETEMDLKTALDEGWPLPLAPPLYVEGTMRRPNGSLVSLGITYAPLLDNHRRMTDIIANVRDLSRYREEQELQKTFISVVSHELKTPVSIIKGYAGTLRRDEADWPPEVLNEYLSVIEEEADQLTGLIDQLLEASRLQSGTFQLEMDDVWLPDIATAVVRKFSSQTSVHAIEMNFPPSFPVIRGDERRLTQVLNNLMSNAIKYSPDGGKITVTGEVQRNYVLISVSDEGIGIPDHQKDRIFEKFSRLDNALSRRTEGTGLGLYLTRAIVEAHDGRIWFSDNDGGHPGTTFTFCLPREGGQQEYE